VLGKTVIRQITETEQKRKKNTQVTNNRRKHIPEITKTNHFGLQFKVSGLRKITCSCIYCHCGLNQLSLTNTAQLHAKKQKKRNKVG